VSISALQSGSWTAASRHADQTTRGRDVPRPKLDATGPAVAGAAPSGTPGGSAASGSFQSLVSDIQAMLAQAQQGAGTATGSSSTPTTGAKAATTSVSPEQQLATDLQAFMGNAAPGGQTASASPTDPVAETPHHHHHHHGGGQASGSTAVAQAPGATPTASGSNSIQSVSRILAGDISKALSAYAGASAATTTGTSTV
jgi:hypothetical protein